MLERASHGPSQAKEEAKAAAAAEDGEAVEEEDEVESSPISQVATSLQSDQHWF